MSWRTCCRTSFRATLRGWAQFLYPAPSAIATLMIEIRTYDGEPAELAAFCTASGGTDIATRWRSLCGAAPSWNGSFSPTSRAPVDFLVAAYDGGRLVGSTAVEACALSVARESVLGSFGSSSPSTPLTRNRRFHSSWCLNSAAAIEFGRRPLCRLFDSGRLGRHGPAILAAAREMHVVGKVGLWVRMIDHRAMSDFLFHPFERRGARVLVGSRGGPKPLVHSGRNPALPRCRPGRLPPFGKPAEPGGRIRTGGGTKRHSVASCRSKVFRGRSSRAWREGGRVS